MKDWYFCMGENPGKFRGGSESCNNNCFYLPLEGGYETSRVSAVRRN